MIHVDLSYDTHSPIHWFCRLLRATPVRSCAIFHPFALRWEQLHAVYSAQLMVAGILFSLSVHNRDTTASFTLLLGPCSFSTGALIVYISAYFVRNGDEVPSVRCVS
jgi:hypothetical protein